ncbi:MAG: RAG2 PHD domain containing protein [Methylocella sp.]
MSPLRESAREGAASDEEPPSLIVGRDDENHWVVVETHGRCGGIFATEAAAVRFAREESRGRPGAVSSAPQPLALNIERALRAARISRS